MIAADRKVFRRESKVSVWSVRKQYVEISSVKSKSGDGKTLERLQAVEEAAPQYIVQEERTNPVNSIGSPAKYKEG